MLSAEFVKQVAARVGRRDATVRGHVQQVEETPQVVEGGLVLEGHTSYEAALDDRVHHDLKIGEHGRVSIVAVAHVEDDHERDQATRFKRAADKVRKVEMAETGAHSCGREAPDDQP